MVLNESSLKSTHVVDTPIPAKRVRDQFCFQLSINESSQPPPTCFAYISTKSHKRTKSHSFRTFHSTTPSLVFTYKTPSPPLPRSKPQIFEFPSPNFTILLKSYKIFMTMGKLVPRSLILLLSFFVVHQGFTTTIAQTTQSCKSFAFQNNKQFSTCNDLPALNSFLYWTYDAKAGTADIAFRVTRVNPSTSWVAWALNPTGQGMIGAQSLVAVQNSSGVMHAYTSDVQSDSISTLQQSSLSFKVDNLSAMSKGNNEIIIFATIKPSKMTVNQVWQVGPASGGKPAIHSLSGANVKSTGTIDFLSGQTTSSGKAVGSSLRKKNIHGVLNAISWGTLMPLGAIIARYLRVFKSADPAWFYLHITCQTSAYVIGAAGWATGLKLGKESVGIVYHAHRNIGITLFCLATLQVFALLLRPKKDHKYRLYWNIYHHVIGYSVIILSILNIYKGFDILEPLKKWKTTYTSIIIALGALAVVLEVFTWVVVLKRKKDDSPKHGQNGNGANGYNNPYGSRTQPMV